MAGKKMLIGLILISVCLAGCESLHKNIQKADNWIQENLW